MSNHINSNNNEAPDKAVKQMPVLPKASWWLVLKNIFSMLQNPLDFMTDWAKEYGDVYDLNARFLKVHVFSNPDCIQEVLVRNKLDYAKSDHYKVLKESLGNGLLISEGAFWKKQRRIAQPAFHHKSMHNFVQTMVQSTQDCIDKIAAQSSLSIDKQLNSLSLDIVTKCLFGTTLAADVHQVQAAINTGNKFISTRARSIIKWPLWWPLPQNIRYKKARKFSDKLIFGIIEKRQLGTENHVDLLSMLMHSVDEETGTTMSSQQLRDECITLFVAGQETTATALTWAFYLLMKHPDKMQKLMLEIETVLGAKTPELSTLSALKYTQMVLEETMRLYPPAWVIARKVLRNTVLCGYPVEEKAQLILDVYSLHRHPDYWDRPDQFIPERFDEKLKKERHRYAYIPFGAGQRLCIGNNFALMEMKIALTMFLQKFQFSLVNPHQKLEPNPMVTLKPASSLILNIRPRMGLQYN